MFFAEEFGDFANAIGHAPRVLFGGVDDGFVSVGLRLSDRSY